MPEAFVDVSKNESEETATQDDRLEVINDPCVCPKCGWEQNLYLYYRNDTTGLASGGHSYIRYCGGASIDNDETLCYQQSIWEEHLHINCQRCGYEWLTWCVDRQDGDGAENAAEN